ERAYRNLLNVSDYGTSCINDMVKSYPIKFYNTLVRFFAGIPINQIEGNGFASLKYFVTFKVIVVILHICLTLSTAATLEWRRRSHGKGVRRPSAAYCCDLLRACSPLVFIGHPMLNANSRYCVPA